ncbi:hypothetical protein QMK19_30275 [Streptomyces sp. H10-C2]|uniref:hypothetical protein n=1 Tax=unclassified Streptomyces TaxID=2593676 RepID=UPI0024BA9245|nr:MULTISPECIES: hypothetical protein [unclassified Streptomyces]MDJ0344922.1 hypothetical protein [Streptomyces sp. PH10-H1]MDJ0373820.1 hypothetical protein [Streptomyces sp. H10-C2]
MIGAASLSPAHRRARDSGVLVVLIWVAFHLLGCMHSHGPGFEGQHYPLNAPPAAAAPVAASGGEVTVSLPQRAPCCPETGDHVVDRIRSDAPAPPALGGARPADTRPDAPAAALTGAGTARAPDHSAVGGRCTLTALCVART